MCDWDKVYGNPKSSFIINAIILNTKSNTHEKADPEADW